VGDDWQQQPEAPSSTSAAKCQAGEALLAMPGLSVSQNVVLAQGIQYIPKAGT
jgi:hypothetical protein